MSFTEVGFDGVSISETERTGMILVLPDQHLHG